MAGSAWDFKTDDTRAEETVNVFVIYCEDEVSEPCYFESFESEALRINVIGNQRSGHKNLQYTVTKCIEAGYMEFAEGSYRLKNMITENLWCVYDRDLENVDLTQIQRENNTGWSLAIQNGLNAGLKVAWSNDAFELWVLLHFEDITPAEAQHRNFIYDRLTDIFKNLTPTTDSLKRFTTHSHFSYKGAFKKRSSFEEFVLPELKKRTADALLRATKLAAHYSNETTFHERNPCTMVHTLVTELLANGGK
ncbi:RloB family protein [Chitinophaga sp. S165]|uniref:RloB family protein n=1 Tax=Chitinophaga sp. S165 TaxID=2135462 RepID=UPI000D71AB72|nr:RloB family protein [Chitinophaga sp. S165]PWV55812.1 RloB-like protein [Chitinophaga sp. S165]